MQHMPLSIGPWHAVIIIIPPLMCALCATCGMQPMHCTNAQQMVLERASPADDASRRTPPPRPRRSTATAATPCPLQCPPGPTRPYPASRPQTITKMLSFLTAV